MTSTSSRNTRIRWNGEKLPSVNNLATLLVCEDLDAAPRAEAMRVLRAFGALVSKRDGKWQATFKPQLEGMDQRGQHFKGADNNAVAQDTVVGPPRRFHSPTSATIWSISLLSKVKLMRVPAVRVPRRI